MPSPRLFFPSEKRLHPVSFGTTSECAKEAERTHASIQQLLEQKDYPCVPARQSLAKGEYLVGVYSGLGEGTDSEALALDLLCFREKQKRGQSLFLSFWAVFPNATSVDEATFEAQMWSELSFLNAAAPPGAGWDDRFSSDPSDRRFCFSFAGDAFFIVGMHPSSSRASRRFPMPAMVFNLYEQFEELDRRGQYQTVVNTNRARDMKFQGSLNPMVERYADVWDAIQFSGKDNPPDWQCPFRHLEAAKPENQGES